MRKIESQMVAAINSNKNWKSGNTEVKTDDANISRVFLHGNHIATITDDDMMIMDGGWQSVTTKSRLNALCDAFCIAGEGVFQKDFTWYVRQFVGKINGQSVFKNNIFTNGYTFAWDDYTEGLTLPPYSLPFILITPIMKTVLVVVIGVLLWQSTDARKFTANALQSASDFVEPNNTKSQTIGERIDSFLDWYMGTLALHR